MDSSHTKIIYVLMAVLFIGLGALLYQNEKLQMEVSRGGTSGSAAIQLNASSTAALAGISIGPANPVTDNVSGTVTQLGGSSFQIKDSGGNVHTVSIGSNTKVQLAGAIKDAVTQQNELAAYNAQVQTLMQDPVKNKAALAALQFPTAQVLTPGTVADLAVGDSVTVAASSITSGGVYVAVAIYKNTVPAPAQ
jgi:hypothetical protein